MRSRFSLSIGILTAILPLVALAAFKSPSSLLASIHFKGQPLNISYETHVESEEFRGSAWVKGQVQASKDIKSVKAALRLTADFAMNDLQVSRVSSQIRIVDGMLYVRIDRLSGGMTEAFGMLTADIKSNEWYAVPLEETAAKELTDEGLNQEEVKKIVAQLVDALFGMTTQTNGSIVTYSLKPKATAAQELVDAIHAIDKDKGYDPSDVSVAEIRNILKRLNVHIKVVATTKDEPKMAKFYASYTHDKFPLTIVLQGSAVPRRLPVSVQKPPESLIKTDDWMSEGSR